MHVTDQPALFTRDLICSVYRGTNIFLLTFERVFLLNLYKFKAPLLLFRIVSSSWETDLSDGSNRLFLLNIGKYILLKRNFLSPAFSRSHFMSVMKRCQITSSGLFFSIIRLNLCQSGVGFFIQPVGSGLVIA